MGSVLLLGANDTDAHFIVLWQQVWNGISTWVDSVCAAAPAAQAADLDSVHMMFLAHCCCDSVGPSDWAAKSTSPEP